MKKLPVLLFVGLFASVAHASPSDELDSFLQERRISSQIQNVGQNVRNTASDLVSTAMGFIGVPYRYGGTSAESGFDCSGFVRATYEKTLGQVLPRRAADQAAATQSISRSELRPGDLVFFNTMRRAFSHVGIYVGDGKFIHAPRSGARVRVESMDGSYWSSRFNGARRVPGSEGVAGTITTKTAFDIASQMGN
ncbi:MAG: C40 family peptidase [Brachymonas denitrificans]|jgi:cell wall-associated NlpC family hydrolase|uniref:C40 family peptidase n=1 Tax=Brachymonas denitrificans TaxID=28220 RepID=UPI001BCE260B|nr:C40 family peptidase [Brachymonas denitrificans]